MKLLVVAATCLMVFLTASAQKQPLNNFEGYKQLPGNSYLKYLIKGNSTTVADTGGAIFMKIFFITETDSVFIDVNAAAHSESFPMRYDTYQYQGDFLYIMGQLHVGDSVKFFMSLDSLNKYYPGEFIFDDYYNRMRYVGMSLSVDSLMGRDKVNELQRKAAEEREAARKQVIFEDSVMLNTYLVANDFPLSPDYNGIWYRTLRKGSAQEVKGGDEVKLQYKCSYPDGKVIGDSTITYVVGQGVFTQGWKIGVARMTEGERAIWIIPSALGYNDGHSLIYEVKLIDIKRKRK